LPHPFFMLMFEKIGGAPMRTPPPIAGFKDRAVISGP